MESLSSLDICQNEQKVQVQNKFILKICKEYHKSKAEVSGFRCTVLEKFRLYLLSKNIILPKDAKALIYKKITNLHSRLVAPTETIEFKLITDWNIDFKSNGREINDSKKPYCQYFKDWFIIGNINI